jgi:hypothetical protein
MNPMRAFALLAVLALPLPCLAQTFQFDTPIAGDTVPVKVELEEVPAGVRISVSIEPGSGDLLGFFANVSDERILRDLDVVDPSGVVRDSQFAANAVSKVGSGNNLLPARDWDLGLQLGRPGSAGGVLTSASFTLRARGLPPGSLTPAMLTSARSGSFVLGVRIQSTSGPQGSSKMGLDAALPTVRILVPATGALLATHRVDVAGLVSAGATVQVTAVNTVDATHQNDMFAGLGVLLNEGLNTIVATATNGSGTASDQVTVFVDTTPPVITLFQPANGQETSDVVAILVGTAEDANGIAAVFVQDVPAELGENGLFDVAVPLVPGANTITVQAVDNLGNIGTAQVVVIQIEGDPQPN